MKVPRLILDSDAYHFLRHWWRFAVDAGYRSADQEARLGFERFCKQDGGLGLRCDLLPTGTKPKTALIVRNISLPYVAIESLIMKTLQMAGFQTMVVGNHRKSRTRAFLRYDRLARNRRNLTLECFGKEGDPQWIDGQRDRLKTLFDWLQLEYRGVHVGRFVIASALRALKIGRLNYADPAIRARLMSLLEGSVRNTIAGERLLEQVRPDLVLFLDRGYLGQGEIFDLAIRHGIDTLTWNLGYRSSLLVFKRYNNRNQREHPLSLSSDTWQRIQNIPWTADHRRKVREELFRCYESQEWFNMVGTQFGKRLLTREVTRERLGLKADRKVALIFPHILWDGSFFFGKDLFDDYTHWLVETIRAACANPRLQWVIKLHPAHVIKSKIESDYVVPAELQAINQAVSELPPHITLVHPETDLSTYALFQIGDYAVTVRGTVGIECALFGMPVVTAGTGRYNGRGFTLDSATREEYLEKLANLHNYSALAPEQVELAERYAYALLFWKPMSLSSASLTYDRDGKATPKLTLHHRTREDWLSAGDLKRLAEWFAEGKAEDMPNAGCN